jgi:hypothetical protein
LTADNATMLASTGLTPPPAARIAGALGAAARPDVAALLAWRA